MPNIMMWWSILAILIVIHQLFSFKNISDAQKPIQDHSVTTNTSLSVYKTEKDFKLNGSIYNIHWGTCIDNINTSFK